MTSPFAGLRERAILQHLFANAERRLRHETEWNRQSFNLHSSRYRL
jgi:hypothetical protein